MRPKNEEDEKMTTDCTAEYKALRAAAEAEGKKTWLALSYMGDTEEENEKRLRAVFPFREDAMGKYIRVGENIAFSTNDGRWNVDDFTRYETIALYEVDDEGEVIDLIRMFGVVEI